MKTLLGFLLTLICLFQAPSAYSQGGTDEKLAIQFYENGEYEKAADIFEKLYSKNPAAYFYDYYNCLLKLKDFKQAEKITKRMIKKDPDRLFHYIDLGQVYEQSGDKEKALKEYEKAIDKLPEDVDQVMTLANSFINYKQNDLAIKTYLKGRKLLKDSYPFYFELADVYQKKGDIPSMINEYISALEMGESYMGQVQNNLQDFLADDPDKKKAELLRTQLLRRVQSEQDKIVFQEMLIWLYLQEKDFEAAFLQTRAMDKRFKQDGSRMMSLGSIASSNKNYDVAIKSYQYVITKGPENYFYSNARMELVNAMNKKITESSYSEQDLTELNKLYSETLKDLGKSAATAPLLKGYAHLKAFYLNQPQEAITMLEELITMPNVPPKTIGEVKLELGDILLFIGERWEATLLYSQVEKAFHEDVLGQEAKFRNARLSYYTGDFEWAQGQLTVLKASTSKLIANDALNLSLLITDNMGLDSNAAPLLSFARADLLSYQNKDSLALLTLDSLKKEYPAHPLVDDILYKKAAIFKKAGKFDTAKALYTELLENHGTDLLGDDALFSLAELEEHQFRNIEKAKEHYQDILTKYPGSLYTVEARKRFRRLRGDTLN